MGGIVTKSSAYDKLTDKEKMFLTEWTIDLNASRAAKEAGYKGKADVVGSQLLKKPKIKAAIKEIMTPVLKKAELTRENVLEQLYNFLFRDIAEFIDGDGYLVSNPATLPPHVRQSIDSWECFHDYDEDGNVTKKRWKVKCVSKSAAIDLAMKYLRLIGPEVNVQNTAVVSVEDWWGKFFDRAKQPLADPIDVKIREMITDCNKGQAQPSEQGTNGFSKPNGKVG